MIATSHWKGTHFMPIFEINLVIAGKGVPQGVSEACILKKFRPKACIPKYQFVERKPAYTALWEQIMGTKGTFIYSI